MSQHYLPFSQVVEEIKQLCRKQVSGSLFISTDCNRSAHVIIESGEINYIYYFNKHGIEALDAMCDISNARHQFQEGMLTDQHTPLPPTHEIIKTLADLAPKEISKDVTPTPVFECSDAQKAILEDCLAEYIGPVAGFICEDTLNSVLNLEAALDKLAAEIPDDNESLQFKKDVLNKLGI